MLHKSSLLIALLFLSSAEISPETRKTLLSSLRPHTIVEHSAFHYLFENTKEGDEAKKRLADLLYGKRAFIQDIPSFDVIYGLIGTLDASKRPKLSDEDLKLIAIASQKLGNKKLKGHHVFSEKEVQSLKEEEIDLARALLVLETGDQPMTKQEVLSYEAMLDLMSLQILLTLPKNPNPAEKIEAINDFLFRQMHFRFPPHSLYSDDVDLYTFLPSVLDSHRGICLGVSTLYICLAQRLDLTLESVTPPGHIYVRYQDAENHINVETTARGIDLPDEVYLSITTKSLEVRNLRQVIGAVYVNQASKYWTDKNYKKAAEIYIKSLQYTPNDPLTTQFLAYQYYFLGEKKKCKQLLKSIQGWKNPHQVGSDPLPQEVLEGKTDAEGLSALFEPVDETRESILKKMEMLKKVVKKHDKFSSGWFALAITYLQLGQEKEALQALQKVHQLDPDNPTAEYYLAAIFFSRYDFPKAWKHLKLAEDILKTHHHHPRALKELKLALLQACPEPL